ncbi:hypothetical protein [Curtobacterium sp. APC 4022]|uniref:hypothetical protein n=1 Tax=Curtobacterium sp. APC 4022 TaxID=3035201 RepID=UPI0025B4B49C|nr:hypothetical protein [Curtobacterium sp. APC 4022]MDN3478263.1 hypothetical protein [Curtobacterium sp. APC 4022]
MTSDTITAHRLTAAAIGVLVVGALVGCASPAPTPTPSETATPVDPDTAQRQMVEAVDAVTTRLGGDWRQRSGPDYAEDCTGSDGRVMARWTSFVTRTGNDGVTDEMPTIEHGWREQGMTVERWGTTSEPTVVGRAGGRLSSISLSVAPGLTSVQSVSLCFPGDADAL